MPSNPDTLIPLNGVDTPINKVFQYALGAASYNDARPFIDALLDWHVALKDGDRLAFMYLQRINRHFNRPGSQGLPVSEQYAPTLLPIYDEPMLMHQIADCFIDGTIAVSPLNQLLALYAALLARRRLTKEQKEVKAFVNFVVSAYPSLISEERTIEKYVRALYDLTSKCKYKCNQYIRDQATMVEYVNGCYKQKQKNKKSKACSAMITLAMTLFEKLGLPKETEKVSN